MVTGRMVVIHFIVMMASAVLAVGGSAPVKGTPPVKRPLIIAHRGASGYLPEHTLAAYELAIDLGADFIEPDLVSTKDGALIARHENEISTTTDVADHPEFAARKVKKRIGNRELSGWFTEDFTLTEVRTLRARQRVATRSRELDGKLAIPTLQEIIDLVKRKGAQIQRTIGIYPETKSAAHFAAIGLALEEPLVRILAANGYQGKNAPVFIQSFEPDSLRKLKRMTEIPLIQLLGATPPLPSQLKEITVYAAGIGPSKNAIVPIIDDGQFGAASSLIADAHKLGLLVHPYTFLSDTLPNAYGGNAEAEYEKFFKLGVDGLFTDFPDVAAKVRERIAR